MTATYDNVDRGDDPQGAVDWQERVDAGPAIQAYKRHSVTQPGGRIVIVDPDQESLVIEVPGVRRELTDAVKALRRVTGYRDGMVDALLPFVVTGTTP